MVCLVVLALTDLCLPAQDFSQEEAFLDSLNLSHLKERFVEQDVRLEMVPFLDNATLSSLGVTTIGRRFDVRAAARTFQFQEVEQDEEQGGSCRGRRSRGWRSRDRRSRNIFF